MQQKKHVYLDHASSTPCDVAVLDQMKPYFFDKYGNPGAMHLPWQETQVAMDEAREKVAKFLNCDFEEIIFTGSATESNNLAIRGAVKYMKQNYEGFVPHIVTTRIEHKSILETFRELEKDGVEVTYLPVDGDGLVSPSDFENVIKKNTVLVSVMYVNNEVGTVQPLKEIGDIVQKYRRYYDHDPNLLTQATDAVLGMKEEYRRKRRDVLGIPYFHTDAVQALNYLDCNVRDLGLDLVTFSGHKIYGPKGIGGLYKGKNVNLAPIITGGGQEAGLRAGTENVPYIVGLGAAIEIAGNMRQEESKRISELRDYFIDEVLRTIPDTVLNGSRKERVANNVNILFRDFPANNLLITLDQEGISASTGSTCTIKMVAPSETLLAMGRTDDEARQSVRFTLGRSTTKEDIDYAVFHLQKIMERAE